MYLEARKFEHNYSFMAENNGENETYTKVIEVIGAKTFVDKDRPSLSVSVAVGYWRKANAVHNWFVSNVQGGNDDCRSYYVAREQLHELMEVCKEVMLHPNKAIELLPTTEGFFFGGTEYDEGYHHDISQTYFMLKKILETTPNEWDFQYQSSW